MKRKRPRAPARAGQAPPLQELRTNGSLSVNTREKEREGEFAGDEGVRGAEAGGELGRGQAAVVVEAAEKICRGKIALLQVTFPTARD